MRLASKVLKPVARMMAPTSMVSMRLRLVEVDGVAIGADLHAGLLALAALELDAGVRVDDDHLRHGLREGDVDRLALAQAQVELVGDFAVLVHAGLDALQATHAGVLDDVARLAAAP